jgi:hypothetical protein
MLLQFASLLASNSIKRTVARAKRNGIFVAIAIVLFLTAYGFALVAGAMRLAVAYGTVEACLFMAAGALLLGIIVLVIMAIIDRQERERARERQLAVESIAAAAIDIVRKQPLLTVAMAAALLFGNLTGSRRRGRD